MNLNIYVASSWKNMFQPEVVAALEQMGHDVYDFKKEGFRWESIGYHRNDWNPTTYIEALSRKETKLGYCRDFSAMRCADVFVLVLPCGRSAHLEAGWAIGQGRPTCILLSEHDFRADLMYKSADHIALTLESLKEWIQKLSHQGNQ